MSLKPVIPRERARRDIEQAIDHYSTTAGDRVALGLIDALERALTTIANNPAMGSPRYAHELDLAGLRSWALKRYPYIIFYAEQEDYVDVWRVLNAKSDLPAWVWIDPPN